MAVVGVTAVVAALVVVPILVGDSNRSKSGITVVDETTPTQPTISGEESTPFGCPTSGDSPAIFAPRELPGGAVLARICPTGPVAWAAPQDPLETGLDELVIQINAAEPVDPEQADCGTDEGPSFVVTFQYDDGTTSDIGGDLGGCGTIRAGGEDRSGAAQLVATYGRLLAEQRAASTPPDDPGLQPECVSPADPAAGWISIVDKDRNLDLTQAVICVERRSITHQVALDPEQAATISADFADHTENERAANCNDRGPSLLIRGVDAWGTPHELVERCGVYSYQGILSWQPSGDVAAMLDAMVR